MSVELGNGLFIGQEGSRGGVGRDREGGEEWGGVGRSGQVTYGSSLGGREQGVWFQRNEMASVS